MIRPALLAVAAAALASPFRAEDPRVREGNARLRAGDPAGALRRYDDAERSAGARAEIEFDRGHASLARGDLAGALAAWRRAAEGAPPALASRALQNAGTALAAAGDRDGAARALEDALSRDPSNDDARWNLEVLLRQRAAGEAPPRDPARALPSDRGARDASGGGDAVREEPDASRDRPAAPPDGVPREEERPRREPLSRQDAETLLDALRARERTAPFSPAGARGAGRADAAKDW
jgi:tetratricopeptide (TPR) repeat protein